MLMQPDLHTQTVSYFDVCQSRKNLYIFEKIKIDICHTCLRRYVVAMMELIVVPMSCYDWRHVGIEIGREVCTKCCSKEETKKNKKKKEGRGKKGLRCKEKKKDNREKKK